jgi:hypothetical protein
MVAISSSSSPSRNSNSNNNSRYSSSPSSSVSSPSSLSHPGNRSTSRSSYQQSSSYSSCRFLTCLSCLVVAQFLLLPITFQYYFSTSLLQQQQQPQQNDLLWSTSRIRTGKTSNNQLDDSVPGDSLRQQQKMEYNANDYRDGTFNRAPLRLKTVTIQQSKQQQQQLYSRIHCVGENYNTETAWQQRSCEFQHLFCFNTSSQRFVVFQSKSEHLLSDFLTQRQYDMHASSTLIRYKSNNNNTTIPRPQTMSIGGINKKWGDGGIPRLEWFPDIVSLAAETTTTASSSISASSTTTWQYYELPPSFIMIPYHSLNGANPGEYVLRVLPLQRLVCFGLHDVTLDLL